MGLHSYKDSVPGPRTTGHGPSAPLAHPDVHETHSPPSSHPVHWRVDERICVSTSLDLSSRVGGVKSLTFDDGSLREKGQGQDSRSTGSNQRRRGRTEKGGQGVQDPRSRVSNKGQTDHGYYWYSKLQVWCCEVSYLPPLQLLLWSFCLYLESVWSYILEGRTRKWKPS